MKVPKRRRSISIEVDRVCQWIHAFCQKTLWDGTIDDMKSSRGGCRHKVAFDSGSSEWITLSRVQLEWPGDDEAGVLFRTTSQPTSFNKTPKLGNSEIIGRSATKNCVCASV